MGSWKYAKKKTLQGGETGILPYDRGEQIGACSRRRRAKNPEGDTLKSALWRLPATRLISNRQSPIHRTFSRTIRMVWQSILPRRSKGGPAAGFLEAYKATILGIKANEAVLARKRIEIDRALYELA